MFVSRALWISINTYSVATFCYIPISENHELKGAREKAYRVQPLPTFACQRKGGTVCQGSFEIRSCEILKSWLKMNVGHLCQYLFGVCHALLTSQSWWGFLEFEHFLILFLWFLHLCIVDLIIVLPGFTGLGKLLFEF